MIKQAIENALRKREERGWDKTSWNIDLHDTIITCSYNILDIEEPNFYPNSLRILKWLSQRSDMILILSSSSYKDNMYKFMHMMKEKHDVSFDYLNENPTVENTEYGDFSDKYYFDIGIDDKHGFDPTHGWFELEEILTSMELPPDPLKYTNCVAWRAAPGHGHACYDMCSEKQRNACAEQQR